MPRYTAVAETRLSSPMHFSLHSLFFSPSLSFFHVASYRTVDLSGACRDCTETPETDCFLSAHFDFFYCSSAITNALQPFNLSFTPVLVFFQLLACFFSLHTTLCVTSSDQAFFLVFFYSLLLPLVLFDLWSPHVVHCSSLYTLRDARCAIAWHKLFTILIISIISSLSLVI